MAKHEGTENWSQPRPPRKRQIATEDNSTTQQITQIVDLDGLTGRLGYFIRRKSLMSVVNSWGQQTPLSPGTPTGFAVRPKVCTGPAMRLQTTVDHSLIRGLVTRIDRCSSGALPMSGSGRR